MSGWVRQFIKRRLTASHVYLARHPAALMTPGVRLTPELKFLIAHAARHRPPLRFVYVGANDGNLADPLLSLAVEFRMTGVLIEPMPEAFTSLRRAFVQQAGWRFENVAIDQSRGQRKLYRVRASATGLPEWTRGIASFDPDHFRKFVRMVPGIEREIESIDVETIDLDSLLRRNQLDGYDVLAIDTEGFDFEILKLASIARYRPMVVFFEHVHLSKRDWDAAVRLLIDAGYRVGVSGEDTVALRNDV